MSYEQKPGQGSVFKNEKKEKDTQPDYKGDATCPCCSAKLWVDQWVKRPEGKKPYMSLSLKAKEERKPEAKPESAKTGGGFDDDIPF